MDKWLTKEGLTAIFTDIAKLPFTAPKHIYKKYKELSLPVPTAAFLSAGVTVLPPLLYASLVLPLGPLAVASTYFVTSCAVNGFMSLVSKSARDSFYPNISEFAKTPEL